MYETLNELCQTINATASLENVTCEISPGLPAQKLKDREEEYSITLSAQARRFFSELGGLKLSWEFHNDELRAGSTFIEGSSKILDFHKMFMGFDGRFWRDELWFASTPDNDLQFLKRLKVLDYYGKDSVQCVCLETMDDGLLSPNLWLFYQGIKPLRMELDLNEYPNMLRQSKAIWAWQFFYSDIDLSDPKHEGVKENCDLTLKWYGEIFSDGFEAELSDRYRKLLGR
jgi:hypothetical protein